MIRKISAIALIGAAFISTTGCKSNDGYKKTKGIEYKIIKDAPGKTAAPGDILELSIKMKVGDSVIADTRKLGEGKPIQMQLQMPAYNGDWMAGIAMLSSGDSAVIRVSVDTLKKAMAGETAATATLYEAGSKITYEIVVVSIKSPADYKKEMETKNKAQQATDDQKLQAYLAQNNITAQKSPLGVYYVIKTPGTGDQLHDGQVVGLRYAGRTLDGHIFDSNTDTSGAKKALLTFPIGQRQVIPGMDQSMSLLKKGSKATLYIPSTLAYGPSSPGPGIPENAVLIFDIEVVEAK